MTLTGRPAADVALTDLEHEPMLPWSHRAKLSHLLAQRTRIVSGWAPEMSNSDKDRAIVLWVRPTTVPKCRSRFGTRHLDGFVDEDRFGRAPRIIFDRAAEVVARLAQIPLDATNRSRKSAAIRSELSTSTVGRIWQAFGLRPHQGDTFEPPTDPLCVETFIDAVGLNHNPTERATMICCDVHEGDLIHDSRQIPKRRSPTRPPTSALHLDKIVEDELESITHFRQRLLGAGHQRSGHERMKPMTKLSKLNRPSPSGRSDMGYPNDWTLDRLDAALQHQRAAMKGSAPVPANVRRDRLDRLTVALLSRADDLAAAVDEDFGGRPRAMTLGGEIASCVQDISSTRRSLERWMRPRRPQPMFVRMSGIRAFVDPTPLGVIGIIAPWNFPVALAIQPAAAALAAGNRVMLKMSELTPLTAEVMSDTLAAYFDPDELTVVVGGPDVGRQFSELPFDHLFFTGSPAVGRQVQAAAARHLVPVTLELGGKNPVVVATEADLSRAMERIARARLANAGQICLSPDYVFVPAEREEEALQALRSAFHKIAYSTIDNRIWCSIVNDHHFQRINRLVDDAASKGATIIEVLPEGEAPPHPGKRGIPPTIVTRVTDDMDITRDEVFGPVLTILPYTSLNEVISYIEVRPSPLAIYWFGPDSVAFRTLRARTRSGGITRNDFALHAGVAGLPFGGVGNSGTGYYHGQYGFDTFSHLRAVAAAPYRYTPTSLLTPPYSPTLERFMRWVFGICAASARRRVAKVDRLTGRSPR